VKISVTSDVEMKGHEGEDERYHLFEADGEVVSVWYWESSYLGKFSGYRDALPFLIDFATDCDVPDKEGLLRCLLKDV